MWKWFTKKKTAVAVAIACAVGGVGVAVCDGFDLGGPVCEAASRVVDWCADR